MLINVMLVKKRVHLVIEDEKVLYQRVMMTLREKGQLSYPESWH